MTWAARRPLVLMYHATSSGSVEGRDSVTLDALASQLRYLRRIGLRGRAMRELLAGNDPRCFGLTFDDGYQDFIEDVVPLVRRLGFSATVFVPFGFIGGANDWDPDSVRRRIMGTGDLREVVREGMEVGSHGMYHRRLTDVTDDDLDLEMRESKRSLEAVLGERIDGVAYPFGAVDERVVRAARDARYHYACSVHPSFSGCTDNRYSISRVGMSQADRLLRTCGRVVVDRVRAARGF